MTTNPNFSRVSWRRRKAGDKFPELDNNTRHERYRCSAIGLGEHGDGVCPHARQEDSAYCYYHDKVERGLIDPTESHSVPIEFIYPIWPLPSGGYVLTGERAEALRMVA